MKGTAMKKIAAVLVTATLAIGAIAATAPAANAKDITWGKTSGPQHKDITWG